MTQGSTRRIATVALPLAQSIAVSIALPLALSIALMTGTAGPLAAGNGPPVVAPIVAQLETEGYALVETHRSWFGRIVILATRDGFLREVVINRATGTVLSDRLFATTPEGAAIRGNAPDHTPDGRSASSKDGGNGGGNGGH